VAEKSKIDWCRFAAAILAPLITLALINTGADSLIDPPLMNAWFSLRGKQEAPKTVSIVGIDPAAYAKMKGGAYRQIAKSLQNIAAAGAKAIIIDTTFQAPDSRKEDNDMLAQAIADTPTVLSYSSEIITNTDPNGVQQTKKLFYRSSDAFTDKAKAEFQAHLRIDNGIVRNISLSNDQNIFSAERVPLLKPLRQLFSPEIKEPGGNDVINYYGPPSTLTNISMSEIIDDGTVDPAYFKDRAVFIGQHSSFGVSNSFGKDSLATPVSSAWMFGVEIHATIAANLIEGNWIRRLDSTVELVLISLAAFHITLLVFAVGPLTGILIGLVAAVGWLTISYYSFAYLYYFIPGITFCLIIGLVLFLRLATMAHQLSKQVASLVISLSNTSN
jgi:CHASE2 domain-containing sensor protein